MSKWSILSKRSTSTILMKRHSLTKITAIGSMAYDLLQEKQSGLVVGRISTGAFIKIRSDRIVYLTHERFRGPLTINLGGDTHALEGIENGMQVIIGSGQLSIPEISLRIRATHGERWFSPLPNACQRSAKGRVETLRAFAAEILALIGGDDFPEVSLWLKAIAQGETPLPPEPGSLFNSILRLHQLTREGDFLKAVEVCQELLGRGEGLTPAGDDLLLGWLLGLNRWNFVLLPEVDLQPLNEVIIQSAYEKTTTISANLIECATRGEGDERLIAVLDALLCEVGEQENIIRDLLSWGNSSGVYVFCGMAIAVLNS